MSGTTSNLSGCFVRWDAHLALERALDEERRRPGVLAAHLRSLALSPTDDDLHTVRRCAEIERDAPDQARWLRGYARLSRLRADPGAQAEIVAAELRAADDEQARWIRSDLLQLAFVTHGQRRWFGDVWCTRPLFLLGYFSLTMRELLGVPPSGLRPPVSRDERVVWAAMSVVDGAIVPDALHPPDEVRAIAAATSTIDLLDHPVDPGPIERVYDEYGRDDDESGDVHTWARDEWATLRAAFSEAAARGWGMDLCWHPNP